jgi:hypothetical protein
MLYPLWISCLLLPTAASAALPTGAVIANSQMRPSEILEIGARRSAAPVKDCTRFNGRYGYYGNPWCTEREQLLWDLYTSGARLRMPRR